MPAQRRKRPRARLDQAGDRQHHRRRVGEEQRSDPSHVVELGGVLLDVHSRLAREQTTPLPVAEMPTAAA